MTEAPRDQGQVLQTTSLEINRQKREKTSQDLNLMRSILCLEKTSRL